MPASVKRRRGGQPGNRNAQTHGMRSRAWRKERAEIRALLHKCADAMEMVKSFYKHGKRRLFPRKSTNE